MSGGLSAAEYVGRYQVDSAVLARAKPGAVYLHPGPINEGVEVTREVCLGPRSLVLEQARNGVPTRMAVLALVTQARSLTRDLSSAIR
jgi:aspartate carbamoyltransferase catalytic subunit